MDTVSLRDLLPITSFSTQSILSDDKLLMLHASLAAIILVMLLAAFNILGGSEKRFHWRWTRDFKKKEQPNNDLSRKYVLITGCDKGLGYATAKSLDKYGYSVIAGCLDVKADSSLRLQEETSAKLKTVQLDVTKAGDIDAVRIWMNENLDGELWGIVNNAGVCFIGSPEIMSKEDINKVMAVNLMGTVNVTTKFLPLVRRAKGRIINIGSISGEVPMPFFSIYNASKAAVKMLTETWSYELVPWGVRVSLVTPAAFQTDIIQYDRDAAADRWWREASSEVQRDYGKDYFKMKMRASKRLDVCPDLSPVTDSVIHALSSPSPRSVYRVGQWSSVLPNLFTFSPQCIRYLLGTKVFNFIPGLPSALKIKSE